MKLLGFIDNGNEKIIITEYVPNGTLREHLDGRISLLLLHTFFVFLALKWFKGSFFLSAPQGEILDFNQRMEIAIDIAHGLTYLHLYAGVG